MRRVFQIVLREIFLSALILFFSTLILFFIAFYATGERQKENMGIDVQQGAFVAYWNLLSDVVHGNIGGQSEPSERLQAQLIDGAHQTFLLVGFAIIWSLVFGLLIAVYIVYNEGRKTARILERFLYLSGSIPIFVIPVFIYALVANTSWLFKDPTKPISESVMPIMFASIILVIGSGVLGEIVRVLKQELKRIIEEPFIHSARARNARVWSHISVTAVIPLTSVFAARVPYFIGAAIVVERAFNMRGLVDLMLEGGENVNLAKLMLVTVIILSAVLVARLLNRLVVALFDPKMS